MQTEGSSRVMPRHVAVVMDGNGRWAKKRHLPRAAGHKAGVNATRRLVENCARKQIQCLTIFAFSSENWNRPREEVSALMSLFVSTIAAEVKKLHDKNVRVRFIGDRSRFADKLQNSIDVSEQLTQSNTGLNLNIAANYGGRWDITSAMQALARRIENGEITAEQVDEGSVSEQLSLHGQPDPDLFIRTGGEQRISNFLIWQSAYAELYFTDKLWPDFSDEDLDLALEWYAGRERRYGKTGEQVSAQQMPEQPGASSQGPGDQEPGAQGHNKNQQRAG
jgi:undecaprenyl diphosphate synthase